MPTFEAVISCNIIGRVGGAASNSNAYWACCKKHRGKWQWDGVFRHRNDSFEAVINCDITGRVGGAAGNSYACWACCQKKRGKGQWDGVFRHRNACF